MRRPTFVGMAVLWVVVVLAVSTLTWTVIDSAGQDVLTAGQEVRPDDGASGNIAPSAAPSAAGDDNPSRTPGSSATREPTSDAPTRTPSQPSPRPSTQPQPTRPVPSRTPDGPAAAQGQVRSWQGAAGTVSARCEGARISLASAFPRDGWGIEVKKRGPDEVDVELESGGDEERRTRVRAECAGGVPRFDVDTD